jgi:selenide,water dikinase
MGARPISALNIVGFPEKSIDRTVLGKIIKGGADTARLAGMPIVGGHTLKAPEPFYGLSITGSAHPERILTNAAAREDDVLYLTKPLGTGLITTAAKNRKADETILQNAINVMKELNKAASEAVLKVCADNPGYICSVTDITGYGLLGHLGEMLNASGKSAILDFPGVPLLPGAEDLARIDQFPGGSRSNLKTAEAEIFWDGQFENFEKLILADAQTSGGLLISIKRAYASALENEMKKNSVKIAKIGKIIKREKWLIKAAKK